ncbi:hypothetical protein [Gimesia sp.]|uniref:hypothetical protein n=1 Tax=Gimesia sp. TaxID=2024833 RepID=UPI003A93D494
MATIADVRLVFEETLIAWHKRDWGLERTCFNAIHYLILLERKPGCFDHAPLEHYPRALLLAS